MADAPMHRRGRRHRVRIVAGTRHATQQGDPTDVWLRPAPPPYREGSKSLAPDGSPCVARTRGVLQRASVIAGQQHFVGKETDRRWEFGDDLSVLRSKSMEYRPRTTVADATLRKQVEAAGVRALMRTTGLSQHTLEAVRGGGR